MNSSKWVWYLTRLSILLLPLLPRLGAIGLGVVVLATWVQQWREIKLRRLTWGFALLSLGLILRLGFVENRLLAGWELVYFLPFFALFIALSVIVHSPYQLRRLGWLIVIPSFVVSVLGLGQYFFYWRTPAWLTFLLGWQLVPGEINSVFGEPAILVAYLVLSSILGLGLGVGVYYQWRWRQRFTLPLGLGLVVIFALNALTLSVACSQLVGEAVPTIFLTLITTIGFFFALMLSGLIAGILWRGVELLWLWSQLTPTPSREWRFDRIIIATFLLAFAGVAVLNLFVVTLFNGRMNCLTWILLGAIAGILHRYQTLFLWRELR